MRRVQLAVLFLVFTALLFSCGGATHSLYSGSFSKGDNYEFDNYFGSFGCNAKYFTISQNKQKVEQVIYYYTCPGQGNPTKFVFNYSNGKMVDCDKYLATLEDNFSLDLTPQEKKLFAMIDTSSLLNPHAYSFRYSDIKGFRHASYEEVAHAFPLIKNGDKLPVK